MITALGNCFCSEQTLQTKRALRIADACILGIMAVAALTLAASILIPPLAIPVVTASVLALYAYSPVVVGITYAIVGLIWGAASIFCSIAAHELTKQIQMDEELDGEDFSHLYA